jgi:hypothetical protein
MEWTPDGGSGLHLDASGPAPLIANVSMKHKRIAKIVCIVLCSCALWCVFSSAFEDVQFDITPKKWGFYVRKLEIFTEYNANGPGNSYTRGKSYTNRVSQIGPIICSEYNR